MKNNRFSKTLIMLFCFLAITALVIRALAFKGDYVQGEIILVFSKSHMPSLTNIIYSNPTFSIPDLDSLLAMHNAIMIKKIIPPHRNKTPDASFRLDRMFLVKFQSEIDARELVDEFSQLPYFESVEVNKIIKRKFSGVKRFEPDTSTEFDKQWNLDWPRDSLDIDAPEAWAIERGKEDVIICIIDMGTMLDTLDQVPWKLHSDFNYYWISEEDSHTPDSLTWEDIWEHDDDNQDGLNDNIIGYNWAPAARRPTEDELGFWRSIPQNYSLWDPNTDWTVKGYNMHGLFVSSIAAATVSGNDIVGIAHNCRVYMLRDGEQYISETDLIQLIDHAASVADVINMSWGIYDEDIDPDIIAAIQSAATVDNCVLVASAGNEHDTTAVLYPARDPYVLGVGSIDSNLTWNNYSNYGAEGDIDVVAVGNYIWVDSTSNCGAMGGGPCPQPITETTGPSGWGTSYAAPQAAGIAALIRSRWLDLDQAKVRERIKNSAYFYWQDTSENRKKYGKGYINAYRALTEWGTITENTEWGGGVTPNIMYVSGDLIIDEEVMLTINKGTVIRIAPEDNEKDGYYTNKVEIIVKGTLQTGSSGSGDIIFKSFTDSPPTNQDWVGIRFESTSQNNFLKDVIIKNAQAPIWNYAPVTLEDCHISDCVEGVISYANIDISGTTIKNASSYGIELIKGNATLENDTISDCGLGLALNTQPDSVASATIVDSYIHDIVSYGIAASSSNRSVTVRRTLIEDTYYGIMLALGSAAEIDNCTIKNNDMGVALIMNAQPVIKNSIIDGNTTNGIYCASGRNVSIKVRQFSFVIRLLSAPDPAC